MAKALKLPRQYYKRRSPPPALRSDQEKFIVNLNANLSSIGPGRNRAINDIRKVLLQDVASAIVRQTREVHINVTMGNQPDVTVRGFKQLYAAGSFQGPTAVVVDGSPTRPIKNVAFAGDITIISEASTALIAEAATFAWEWLLRYASAYRGPYSGMVAKKRNNFSYHKSFEMFINNGIPISGPADLKDGEAITTDDWISISNWVPYAAFLERYRYPKGAFYMAWKKTRAKYGKRLAIRMDYVESTGDHKGSTLASTGGAVRNAQPVLRIGQAGAFPSRVPPMRKIISNAAKRGRG